MNQSLGGRLRTALRASVLAGVAALCLGFAPAAHAVKHVLLLFPYEDALGTNAPLRSGMSEVLHGAGERVELYSEFLDATRFPTPDDERHMVEFLQRKYAANRIDLVVTIGQPAYVFLQRYRDTLFPEQPWVLAGIRDKTLVNDEVPPNAVAVLSHFDSAGALDLALTLQPNAREAIFLTGASALDQRWIVAAHDQLPGFENRVRISYMTGEPIARLLERLAALPSDTIVIYQVISRDGDDEHFISEELVEPISQASSAPVYGVFETYLGRGIVGGRMESWTTIGGDVGRAVLNLLAGDPQPVRSYTAEPTFVVDWRQLRRWGLDEGKLPAGTTVLYREPSAWDQYKSLVFIVTALVAVQALLIAVWLLRLRKLRAERALKLAEAEAHQQREKVTHLARVAILGQMSGALAHELNQPLTAILTNAQAGQQLLARGRRDSDEIERILADIVADDRRAGEVIARLRAMLRKGGTRLEPLDIGMLLTEVLALARGQLSAQQVAVRTHLTPSLPHVLGDRVQLQQVLLNLLLNASEAMCTNGKDNRRVTVSTKMNAQGCVIIKITDNGPGLDAAIRDRLFEPFVTTKENGLGLGLSICQSIMATHNGQISAAKNPEGGATFTVTLPGVMRPASFETSHARSGAA
jgi:signal transduction histidine kinase